MITRVVAACGFAALAACFSAQVPAASLVVDLGKAEGVTLVGAVSRWDSDGNPRREVDPKAQDRRPRGRRRREAGRPWPLEVQRVSIPASTTW